MSADLDDTNPAAADDRPRDFEPEFPPPADGEPSPPLLVQRVVALIEVLLCSDYATQAALGATFAALGFRPYTEGGHLSVTFVTVLSLADTVLLVGLMVFFLLAHGERPRQVFFGTRAVATEFVVGIPLVLVALAIGIAVLATVQQFAPSLHTVERNPLQDLISDPRSAWLFALVVIVAGGIREELQRAFLLHRFERWLGGPIVGLVAASVAFGAGHLLQGVDAALATGLLGAFWGVVYLRRRSVVAPMVSHAGFDLLQIVQFFVVRP
jgi:membrane protease YdiL (CAAX protease family)